MEQSSIWVTIGVGVAITVVGAILNTLITNKINEGDKRDAELEKKQKEDKDLIFKRIDDIKEQYVRKDLYEQAVKFQTESNDEKFRSLLNIVNTQFLNVENKIDNLKALINEKFAHKKDA